MKNSSNKFRKNNKDFKKNSHFGYFSKNTNRSEKNDRFLSNSAKNKKVENLKNDLPFIIYLTKIDFLDSSGLGALVQTAKECKNSKLNSIWISRGYRCYSTCLAWRFGMGAPPKAQACSFPFKIQRPPFICSKRSKSKISVKIIKSN